MSRGILPKAGLDNVAEDGFVNFFRIDPGATRGFSDNLAAEFRKPQFHPKWLDVNLAVNVKGWKRFEPAEEWLKSNYSMYAEKGAQPDLSPVFSSSRAADGPTVRSNEKELFEEFLKWKQLQRPGR